MISRSVELSSNFNTCWAKASALSAIGTLRLGFSLRAAICPFVGTVGMSGQRGYNYWVRNYYCVGESVVTSLQSEAAWIR